MTCHKQTILYESETLSHVFDRWQEINIFLKIDLFKE